MRQCERGTRNAERGTEMGCRATRSCHHCSAFRLPRSAFEACSAANAGPPTHRRRGTRAGRRDGAGARARRRRTAVTAVVPVYHPRRDARRAVKSGYPRDAGSVRLCRSLPAVERLLAQRLVDAVVLDVKAAPTLPADLARTACAADLLGNPGYSVRQVVRILGYASPSHLAGAARRVAGATPQELRELGPRGVLTRFLRGRTRSRI